MHDVCGHHAVWHQFRAALQLADLDGQAIYDQCMAIVERIAPDYTDPFATEFHYTDWDLTCVEDYVS